MCNPWDLSGVKQFYYLFVDSTVLDFTIGVHLVLEITAEVIYQVNCSLFLNLSFCKLLLKSHIIAVIYSGILR